MKNYPKVYEDVYNSKVFLKQFSISRVKGDGYDDVNRYVADIQDEFNLMYNSLFDHWVKIDWLLRKFRYNRKKKIISNGNIAIMYGVFMLKSVGVNNRFLRFGTSAFSQISSYFDDFFPDFDSGNPFESNYEYPYKHITLDFLVFVYKMDERLELLKEAEDKKMSLTDFYDYVINYCGCLNSDLCRKKYVLMRPVNYMPYIMKNKYERRKKT